MGMLKVPPKEEEDIQELEVVREVGSKMNQGVHSSFIDVVRKDIRHHSSLSMMLTKGDQPRSL